MARVSGSVVLLVTLGACGSDGPDAYSAASTPPATRPTEPTSTVEAAGEASPAAPNGDTVDVQAIDNSFRVETIEIIAGTNVRWENRGRNDHNIVSVDESVTWGVDTEKFLPGDEYTALFDTPGTYPYFCSIHGTKDAGMIGTVVVLPADS